MSNKILILFISLIFFSDFLLAQTTGKITGKVIDAKTKEPLIGANVLVLDTQRGGSTDLNGIFTIDKVPVGTYRLRFDYIGYESIIKTDIVVISANPTMVNAELSESVIAGQEVTVTAGYFVEEDKIQPSTIGLSREEIRRYPGGFEDVVRTVSTLPGVSINAAGGRNDLLVRGGGPSENLYIINNIEVPNINHFGNQGSSSGSLSFVNLDFVQDVAFSTGGFSAQYGDKMSSVLSLQMMEKLPENFSTKFTISSTQYGMEAEVPIAKKGNFIFSARKSYLDLIFKAAGLPFIPVYTDFNIIVNYNLTPRDKIFFLGLSAIDNVDRDQSSLENRIKNAGILDNTQYQGISGLNYRRLLSNGYLDFTLGLNLFRYRFSQVDENEAEYFASKADEWEMSFKVQHTLVLSKSLDLKSGISAKNFRNNNTTTFADTIYDRSGNRVPVSQIGVPPYLHTKMNAQKIAAFTEFDWLISPRLNLNAGIRADVYQFLKSKIYIGPRASVRYQLTSKLATRLSGGIYFQSPSYVWVTNPYNRNLKALQNKMGVLGFDYLFRDDLRLSLETYYKKYSDLPSGILPGVTDYLVLTNTGTGFGGREDDFQSFGYYDLSSTGSGTSFGTELLLQKKFSEIPLYGLVSFSLGKSEITAHNGRTYPGQYDQRFIFNLSGGYIFNSKWEFSTKFRYFTGVPYTTVYRPSTNPKNPGSVVNLPEEYLNNRTPAGHHLDIRVDRYFNFKGSTLIVYLDVQNVYNFKIPQRPRYDFWTDKISSSSPIGILPSLGISLEF